jgi:lipoprotein NlpI
MSCASGLDQTIQKYDSVIKLDPANPDAFNNRGWAYYYSGDLGQAIQDFNKAIELDPTLAIAYYNRGKACHDIGELELAVSDFERYIELAPTASNRVQVINTIGMIKSEQVD